MPTSFENFVNTELPKRIATNESPTTPQAGDIPVFTGVGLLTESKTASEAGLATETFATNAANTAETSAKSYADGLITSIYNFQTTYDPQTTGNFPTTANTVGGVAIKKGFTWVVSGVTGQYTFQGVTVDNGDTLLALVDNASATSAADWHITEKNLGYTPENSSNKYSNNDLAGNAGTYPATPNVKAYVDTGLSGKQNTLADVITAGTYGSSTEWPKVTVNAKGIVTGVVLQTVPMPTFTDANFSVQKNGSPSIAASWSLTALTASRVHTYPDKDIDFKTLSSIGASDGNTLSGTRNRIVGGSSNNVSGTDNVAIGCNYVKMTGSSNTAMSCAGSATPAQATEFAGTGNTFTSCSGYILGTGCTLVSYSGFTYYANLRAAYNQLVVPRHSSVVFNTFGELSITSGVYATSGSSSSVLVDADGMKPVMWINKSFGNEVSEHIVKIRASTISSVFYGERKVLYKAGDGGTPLVTTIGTDFGTYGMELTVSIVITATGTGNKDMSITVQNGVADTEWTAKIESTHF